MSVSDGATTRKDRLMEMLQFIEGFMPKGTTVTNIQLHMSLAHGLTFRKSNEYVHEMQLGGILMFEAGLCKIQAANFKRLLELEGGEADKGIRPPRWMNKK